MNKIITCIDGSSIADAVCTAACWAAKKLDKTLMLLHAIEKNTLLEHEDYSGAIGLGARSSLLAQMAALDEQRSKLTLALGKEHLEHAAELVIEQGCHSVEKVQRHGGIVEAIADMETEARLIVMGKSGLAHEGDFQGLGSHIERVIRQVHTPLLIANASFQAPQSFMLAYDGRETADKSVQRIIEGGLLQGLSCHLVSVKNNSSASEEKFKQTEALLTHSGFTVTARLLEGPVFETLMAYKLHSKVDLLVMGAFSHSKLASVFLGSNTLKMLEKSQLPMLVLR